MLEFFRGLFGTDFMPHLYCLRGDPGVLWLQVLSDLAIALAYFAIPFVLLEVVRKRKDILFRRVAFLFVLFIAACGTTHVLAVWTIWHPMYRLEAVVNAATALLSVTTAIVLARRLPQIHRLPGVSELENQIEEWRRAEAAAAEKEERFRNFVESVEDYALFMIDPSGVIESWNQGAERMKGYTADEIIGQNIVCFYTEEDRALGKPEETLRIAAETGIHQSENWAVRKDGSRHLISVITYPIRDGNGKLRGFSKISRDITESRELETRFQTLLEAAPDAFMILRRTGEIEFINKQGERMFGYSRAEVLGKPVDIFDPERVREAQARYREAIFSGPGRKEAGSHREFWGLRKDGGEFPVESTISPLDTRNGRVFLFAVRDITERRKTEARFRALLESAPDAMVIVKSDGMIELVNAEAERLFGYSREELIGQCFAILIPEHLRDIYKRHRAGYFVDPKPRQMGADLDLWARRKDGSLFPVEISLSPLEGQGGISVTAAIRDTTERRQAAKLLAEKVAELRHTNDELQQFAHIASHDLQEPLRMVASYTQLLANRYKGRLDADADEFIAYAVDGTKRMKELIEDLLTYSRTGKSAVPPGELSSEEALGVALHNLRASIQESGAAIVHDPLPRITAVYSQLVQIFQNLIGNAIKYRGGRVPAIHISAVATDNEWIFSVADNGIGINPKYFERIFVIFQRLHGREEYEGTGIGLAICKRILQQQGGRIWVESEPGCGSTFHFALPMR
jgi:PAS domain S-box-containing protein